MDYQIYSVSPTAHEARQRLAAEVRAWAEQVAVAIEGYEI